MNRKKSIIKKLLKNEIEDIIALTVPAQWYRMHVDIDYKGEGTVEIVECIYKSEMCAMPAHMTRVQFDNMPAKCIAGAWEI